MVQNIPDELYEKVQLENWEFKLVRTPEICRMEQIKQLGLSYLSFPARHTRYEHSIGVAHLTKLLTEHLKRISTDPVKKELDDHRNLLRAASLLHDCGHTPFSHTLDGLIEMLFGKNHETLSSEIVECSKSIGGILKKAGVSVEDVASILLPDKQFHIAYIQDIVQGDTDVDRIDYLKRDAFHTKRSAGVVDHESLIESMCIEEIEPKDYERTLRAFEDNLVDEQGKREILTQITKVDKTLGDRTAKFLDDIEKKAAEILKEHHVVLDFERRHAAIGLLMTREVMYPLLYRYPTTRAYENVFTKVVEYCINDNLIEPSPLYDAEKLVECCNSGQLINDVSLETQLRKQSDSYVKKMLRTLDARKPMLEAFRASFWDLRNLKPTIREIAYTRNPQKKYHLLKGIIEKIASEIGLDYWHVFIDIYSIKEEKGLVNALVRLPDNRIVTLAEASSIVDGLRNSPVENWEAVVRLPEKVNGKEFAYDQSIRRKIKQIMMIS